MTHRPQITSRHNPRIKEAARLRVGRERRRRGQFLVDGGREILRAIEAGVNVVEAFVCEELNSTPESSQAAEAAEAWCPETWRVTPEVFEKLAFGDRHDGVIVVASAPQRTLGDLALPARPIVAVLERIEKPGNLGAILRSADGAGIDAVVVADGRTDLYNPNTIRASIGTVFRQNVCEATSSEAVDWLESLAVPVIAAQPNAKTVYTEVDLRDGAAIVLGSEAEGLSAAWRARGITPVQLPMRGLADSLNVSTTAAILFYEALRQRP